MASLDSSYPLFASVMKLTCAKRIPIIIYSTIPYVLVAVANRLKIFLILKCHPLTNMGLSPPTGYISYYSWPPPPASCPSFLLPLHFLQSFFCPFLCFSIIWILTSYCDHADAFHHFCLSAGGSCASSRSSSYPNKHSASPSFNCLWRHY